MAVGPGHITDVWALGNYAYLGSFDEPRCSLDFTGVHIVDISDPSKPSKVGFIPSPQGARANDVKVAQIETPYFRGNVLVHSNEPCSDEGGADQDKEPLPDTDGVSIYDVTEPLKPKLLRQSFLDVPVHNTYILPVGQKTLLLVVSDGRFIGDFDQDFYILDISDPATPNILSLTGAPGWGLEDQKLGIARVAGLHDVWAQTYPEALPNPAYAGRTIAYLSYWDAGLIILDISNPVNPVFMGKSKYLDPDPVTGQPPEGNSHVAVPTEDGSFVFMGDEDLSPSHTTLAIGADASRREFRAVELAFTRPIMQLEDSQVKGPATFVGTACDAGSVPLPAGSLQQGEVFIAIIERGGCRADEKIANVVNAGYGAAVVFNRAEDPRRLSRLDGDPNLGSIPAALVSRETGLAVLGIDPDAGKDVPLPNLGTPAGHILLYWVFDGWGYGRILDVRDPGNISEAGQYAIGNTMSKPSPPGAHSMHNVIVQERRAYISWYGDGIRVVDFSNSRNPREVAHFTDPAQGSDFWGVYLHQHPNGKTYILGSDRSTGLWIFDLP